MDKLNYTSHELAARIGKAPKDFTKKDIWNWNFISLVESWLTILG